MPPAVTTSQPGDWLVDLSGRTKLRLTGSDRVRFLNGQVSNDVRRVAGGHSVYTCVMTIKGKMCADAFVHAGPEFLLLDAEGELRESLAARLERYIIADDVLLEDVTDAYSLFHLLVAPTQSTAAVTSAAWGDTGGNPTEAGEVQAVESTRFGVPGIDLFVPAALSGGYLAHLAKSFRMASLAETEALRIKAGVPRWGAELTEDTMPAEAGLEERAVSYDKGCYIGQEVVSRVKSVGHVNWQLRGLRAVGADVSLVPGQQLRVSGATAEGRPVGRVTSVAPALEQAAASALALGYVRRGHEAPGTRLDVHGPEGSPDGPLGQVEVCSLPISNS